MMNSVSEKYRSKIKSAKELREILGVPPRTKKVIMCHGVFDVVHPGHVRHLMYAKSKADILVASLTSDAHIAKENFRPFVPEELRAINLAALEMVDYVTIDHEPTPINNLGIVQPDYFAKGYEYVAGKMSAKTEEEKAKLDEYGGEFIFTPGDVVYSSSKLIELSPPSIAADKLLLLLESEGLTFDDLRNAVGNLKNARVHVMGDTIVDSYTQTSMIGGQTKTPTLSVRYDSREDYVGGAGVVAKHLRAAGADVKFSTVLGNDELKDFVLEDLEKADVETHAVISDTRPTVNKNAIVCGAYRLLKIDTLDNRSISEEVMSTLQNNLKNFAADAVVFSDFRHGIFNPSTIPQLIDAIPPNTFRVADSQVASRWGNICDFKEFDLITPNEREARFSLGDQDSVIRPLALQLYNEAKCKHLILTMGERGLLAYRPRESAKDVRSFFVVDSFADTVKDAVGSGDALLSYATLAHLTSGDAVIATVLGAMAAACECEFDGNIPVTPEDVIKKINGIEVKAHFSGNV